MHTTGALARPAPHGSSSRRLEAFYDEVDPLPFLVTVLAGLVIGLWSTRALEARRLGVVRARFTPRAARSAGDLAVLAAIAAASGAAWAALPLLTHPAAHLAGDAASHVRVAQEIAAHGLPHGWIESYGGGFPFGPHYQSGALLAAAGIIELGAHPVTATIALGLVCMLVVPIMVGWGALAMGASRSAALLAGLFLSWMWPLYHWIGGIGVMLGQGLVSQAFATPVCVATGIAILTGRPRGAAPILAALAVAAHAQLTICAFAATAPAVLLYGSRGARVRYVLAGAAGAVMAIAHYGPGAAAFALPFSWADVPLFDTLGWGAERLPRWFVEGQLFDQQRAPVLCGLLWLSTLALLFARGSRAAKGALVFFATTTFLSVAGVELLPVIGPRVFEIFSPVRMMCVLPFAAATVVVVAWTEIRARIAAASGRGPLAWAGRLRIVEVAAIAAIVAGVGLPHRRALHDWLVRLDERRVDACASEGFAGFDDAAIRSALASADDGGRVVIEHEARRGAATPCPVRHGLELVTPRALGAGTAGPGSQLGVLTAAFRALKPERSGAAARAEALGVRTIVHPSSMALEPPEGWRRVAGAADTVVSVRALGTDLIGVGCVAERWTGADRALRDALFLDLRGAAPATLDPSALIEIAAEEGDARREPVPADGCRASAASATLRSWGPGEIAGSVVSPDPVDVVIRATYMPTWSITVDGAPMAPRQVAPGFLAVRVPAGEHEIRASAHPLPGYGLGLWLAAGVVLLLGWVTRRRDRRPARLR